MDFAQAVPIYEKAKYQKHTTGGEVDEFLSEIPSGKGLTHIGYCIKEANIYNVSIKPFHFFGNTQDEK